MHRTFSRLILAASLCTAAACTHSSDELTDVSADPIVGGVEAQAGAWQGTVALYVGAMQACGGTLVADSWVLTAGHCVSPSSPTGGISKVVISRQRLSSSEGETRTVDFAVRHPRFDRSTMDNDLALLHLGAPSTAPKAHLLSSVQSAAVAPREDVTVVGWGNKAQNGASSDTLREVSVPIISNEDCKGFPRYAGVTDNMICAGFTEGAHDACQGDSGGPLFQKIDGRYVQVGIVSWGIGCARPNSPGVYTRIGNYLGWLAEKTNGAVGESGPSVDGGAPVDGGPSTDGGAPIDGGPSTDGGAPIDAAPN